MQCVQSFESQAEWIKSISSARGFFRNAPPLQLAAPIDEEAADEDEPEEVERKAEWVEMLQPAIGAIVQQLITTFASGRKSAGSETGSKWELADILDWRRAQNKSDGTQKLPAGAPLEGAALQQALAGKAMAIAGLLEPDERTRLMRIAPMFSKLVADPEIARMAAELVAMSTEDAAAWIRAHIAEIEKGLAS